MLVFFLLFLSASLAIPLNSDDHALTKREVEAGDHFEETVNGVKRRCFWSGTAPVCKGKCPGGTTEVERRCTKNIPEDYWWCFWWNPCKNDPYFGAQCMWGTEKAKCCFNL